MEQIFRKGELIEALRNWIRQPEVAKKIEDRVRSEYCFKHLNFNNARGGN